MQTSTLNTAIALHIHAIGSRTKYEHSNVQVLLPGRHREPWRAGQRQGRSWSPWPGTGREGLRPILMDLIEGSGGALYALGTWHNHLTPSGPSNIDRKTAALLCVQQYFPLLMLIHTPNGYLHFTAQALNDLQILPLTAPTAQEKEL